MYSTKEVPAVQILDGPENLRIRRAQAMHASGPYLGEFRDLGWAVVAEVRVSTSSRSDLLSKLKAQGNTQLRRFRHRNSHSSCDCKI